LHLVVFQIHPPKSHLIDEANRAEYVSAGALKTVTDMGMIQGITETWNRLEEVLQQLK
jgi:hypothetical protein